MNIRSLFITGAMLLFPLSSLAVFDVTLSLGSRGAAVVELQTFLKDQKLLATEATGYFGPATRAAVIAFQKREGIATVGSFGPLTRARARVLAGKSPTEPATMATKQPPAPTTVTAPQTPPAAQSRTLTLPSGTVVEIDAKGNFVRTLSMPSSPAPSQTPATPAPQPSASSDVQIMTVTTAPTVSSCAVSWETNVPTTSKLFVVRNGSLSIMQSSSGLSTRHVATIDGLAANTTYTFDLEAIAADSRFAKRSATCLTNPDQYEIRVAPTKTSVVATGWNEIAFSIREFKNGIDISNVRPAVTVTTPDPAQNVTFARGNASGIIYRPKTAGTHRLRFDFPELNVSKTVDVIGTQYDPVPPTVRFTQSERLTNPISMTHGSIGNLIVVGSITSNDLQEEQLRVDRIDYELVSSDLSPSDVKLSLTPFFIGQMIVKGDSRAFDIKADHVSGSQKRGAFRVRVNRVEVTGTSSGKSYVLSGLPFTSPEVTLAPPAPFATAGNGTGGTVRRSASRAEIVRFTVTNPDFTKDFRLKAISYDLLSATFSPSDFGTVHLGTTGSDYLVTPDQLQAVTLVSGTTIPFTLKVDAPSTTGAFSMRINSIDVLHPDGTTQRITGLPINSGTFTVIE